MRDVDYGPLFEQYQTKFGTNLEFIGQTLYDSVTLVSGTDSTVNLFDAKRANLSLGNLPLAGTLPDPQGFLMMSIRFYPVLRPRATTAAGTGNVQAGSVDDMHLLIDTGVLLLTLQEKKYGQWPLWMLPSGGGTSPFLQTGDIDVVVDTANNGVPDARNAYVLQEPLFIPPVTSIGVQLFWPAVVTLASGNTQLKVALDGMMVRPVQ